MKLKCVICDKKLENVTDTQPYCGVAFSSGGNYGSRVYDPMDGSIIEICVCDECLVVASNKKQVYESYTITVKKTKTKLAKIK